jgi:hypothetical protein
MNSSERRLSKLKLCLDLRLCCLQFLWFHRGRDWPQVGQQVRPAAADLDRADRMMLSQGDSTVQGAKLHAPRSWSCLKMVMAQTHSVLSTQRRLTMAIMFVGSCLLTGAHGPNAQVFLSVFCFSLFNGGRGVRPCRCKRSSIFS